MPEEMGGRSTKLVIRLCKGFCVRDSLSVKKDVSFQAIRTLVTKKETLLSATAPLCAFCSDLTPLWSQTIPRDPRTGSTIETIECNPCQL